MAKLGNVIGAILREVTHARIISDNYSGGLRSTYKADPFLKLLAVPRTDIKAVTIDLKFSMQQSEQAFAPKLYVNYKEKGINGRNVSQVEFGTEEGRVLGMYRRIGLKTWVEEQLSNGAPKVVAQFNEDRLDDWGVYLDNGVVDDPALQQSILIDLHTQKITTRGDKSQELSVRRVLSAAEPESAIAESPILPVEVEVVAEQLMSLPESALSSIVLTLDMTSV